MITIVGPRQRLDVGDLQVQVVPFLHLVCRLPQREAIGGGGVTFVDLRQRLGIRGFADAGPIVIAPRVPLLPGSHLRAALHLLPRVAEPHRAFPPCGFEAEGQLFLPICLDAEVHP